MANTKKPAGSKRIIDVAHPDKTAPAGNSKSVIVSNRPLLPDPMVVPEDEASATPAPAAGPVRVAPELKVAPKPNEAAEAEAATETPVKPTPAEEQPEPAADAPQTPKGETAHTKQLQADAEAETKRQAQIDQLADSKQYYLPIDTIENKRSRRVVALGILLSLVLIIAWADIALDAGLIQLGNIKPVTHFFSN